MGTALQDLAAAGVAVWLDDLSRTRIHSGSLAHSVEAGEIVGITTNPTIFSKAIGSGSGYDDQVRDLAVRGTSIGETVRLLTAWDVRAACDILRPVFEKSGGRDGRVSIEVDPRIAQDTARTAAEARGLWWLVDRRHPGRPAGDHRNARGRHQRQRHADLLGGALQGGAGGVPQRPRTTPSGGRQPARHRERRLLLRQPRRYRG